MISQKEWKWFIHAVPPCMPPVYPERIFDEIHIYSHIRSLCTYINFILWLLVIIQTRIYPCCKIIAMGVQIFPRLCVCTWKGNNAVQYTSTETSDFGLNIDFFCRLFFRTFAIFECTSWGYLTKIATIITRRYGDKTRLLFRFAIWGDHFVVIYCIVINLYMVPLYLTVC